MSEDSIKRLFDKIDNLSERLAVVETILAERAKSYKGITNTVMWCITTAIAVYAAAHK